MLEREKATDFVITLFCEAEKYQANTNATRTDYFWIRVERLLRRIRTNTFLKDLLRKLS